jgi:hypothetical protein
MRLVRSPSSVISTKDKIFKKYVQRSLLSQNSQRRYFTSKSNNTDSTTDAPIPLPKDKIDFGRGWPADELLAIKLMNHAMIETSSKLNKNDVTLKQRMFDYGYPVEGDISFRESMANFYNDRLSSQKHKIQYQSVKSSQFIITGGIQ